MAGRKPGIPREHSIRIPVTEEELQLAKELAEHAGGLSIAALLRNHIRALHEERIGPKGRKRLAR